MTPEIKIIPLLETLRLQKISDEEYFSEKYNGYISNSRLSLIDPNKDGSPEKFFAGLAKNKIYSDALLKGSSVHCLCLQPESFELAPDLGRPTAKLGFVADILYSKCNGNVPTNDEIIAACLEVDYYSKALTDRRIEESSLKCRDYLERRKAFQNGSKNAKEILFLDKNSIEVVNQCVSSLTNNQRVQTLLHPTGLLEDPISENEQAILLDVLVEIDGIEPFTLRLKSKLDNYTIDLENNIITINDIKTIGKILSEFDCPGTGNITKFSYNRELAMYSWLLSLCVEKFYDMSNPTVKGNYLVVSTIPQYYSKVVPVTAKMYKEGWNEFVTLLKLVAKCYGDGWRFD